MTPQPDDRAPDKAAHPAAAPRPAGPPMAIRVAGVLIGLEGLVMVGFVGYLLSRVGAAAQGVVGVLGEAGMFLLVGAGMLVVGVGLLRGRAWARTPGIVLQLLLLPAVYSLLGPSRQVVAGIVAGLVVLVALMSLLSEPARRWSAHLDEARRGE